MDILIQQLGSTKQSWSFLRFPFIDLSQFTIHWDIVEEPPPPTPPPLVRFRLINFNKYSVKVDTKQKRQLQRPTGNANYLACIANVSVRFRSKERGARVKDRGKNDANKREPGQTKTLATQATCISQW